jgi:hypothetical protein
MNGHATKQNGSTLQSAPSLASLDSNTPSNGHTPTNDSVPSLLMKSTDEPVEEENEASFNPSIMQTKEERELLEMIDEVKIQDRSNELDVPELVVCGSQSSGKSSVLEALTTIPFPRGVGTCTLFVTE